MHELALWGGFISRVGPGQHPQYIHADFGQKSVGGSLTKSTAQTSNEPTTSKFFQHGSGASVVPGRERSASVLLVVQDMRRAKTRPRLEHTAKQMRISPSIGEEMLTITVCTHANRAERAYCDPRFQETDIDRVRRRVV